jgi:acyl-CoA synthetase (AMP-forming)/AMP-acid ligase II
MITEGGRHVTRKNFPGLEMVMTGAEVCDPGVINVWKDGLPEVRVINVYGPTEATIVCTAYEIEAVDHERVTSYPIGRPLRGVAARLVDDDVEVHVPGRVGELWIGGEQVMNGYFDQPEETARRVVEVEGVRYYRTGDLCSFDEEGDLVFHRHGDEDVTWLAGRRTHLSEVRRVASDCAGVDRAAAGVIRHGRRDVLALVVTAGARQVLAEVKERLRELPDYMRPTLLAWSPADAVLSTGDLLERLTTAVQQSDSDSYALSADDVFEPIDEVEPCL